MESKIISDVTVKYFECLTLLLSAKQGFAQRWQQLAVAAILKSLDLPTSFCLAPFYVDRPGLAGREGVFSGFGGGVHDGRH